MTDEWYEDFYRLGIGSERLNEGDYVMWRMISLLCKVCEIPMHGMSGV